MTLQRLKAYRENKKLDPDSVSDVEEYVESLKDDKQTQKMFILMFIEGDKKRTYQEVANMISPKMSKSCVRSRIKRTLGKWQCRSKGNINDQCKSIINHYGISGQQIQLQQECAELIVASTKCSGAVAVSDLSDNFIEELVDVEIMVRQFKSVLTKEQDKKLAEIRTFKLDRQRERIAKEKEVTKNKKSYCDNRDQAN